MKVYCCFSLYNLYIAVAKAMVQNEKIDLVIGSQMPDYKNKIETIKSLDIINDIYVFDSVDYKNIKYKNIFVLYFLISLQVSNLFISAILKQLHQ